MTDKSTAAKRSSTSAKPSGSSNGRRQNGHAADAKPAASKRLYDCAKCPGYCCSYPVIALDKRDVARLAAHHGLGFEAARKAFTREDHGKKYVMRRKKDPHFGRICRFFDTKARRCTIYTARPSVCRSFPGEGRCGYYDFLTFERRSQKDPAWIASTDHGGWK